MWHHRDLTCFRKIHKNGALLFLIMLQSSVWIHGRVIALKVFLSDVPNRGAFLVPQIVFEYVTTKVTRYIEALETWLKIFVCCTHNTKKSHWGDLDASEPGLKDVELWLEQALIILSLWSNSTARSCSGLVGDHLDACHLVFTAWCGQSGFYRVFLPESTHRYWPRRTVRQTLPKSIDLAIRIASNPDLLLIGQLLPCVSLPWLALRLTSKSSRTNRGFSIQKT